MEALREQPGFASLPAVQDVHLAGPSTYRYVRQDTGLWDDLHAGVCTTGILNAALGCAAAPPPPPAPPVQLASLT